MTDGVALGLAFVIGGVVAADLFVFGWDLHILLGRRFLYLVEYLAFWR